MGRQHMVQPKLKEKRTQLYYSQENLRFSSMLLLKSYRQMYYDVCE